MDDKIVQIKIHLESNIPGMNANTILTSDILYMSNKEKQEAEEPIPRGQMPYFTVYTKFSKQNLQNSSKGGIYRAFFDEETFKRTLGKNLDGSLTEDDKHANAMYNIQFMLTNLFPTAFPVKNNFHDTFQENCKRTGTNVTSSSSSSWLKSIKNFFSGSSDKKDDSANGSLYYGGSVYSVVEIVLLNDVLNNPFYQPYLQQVKLFNQWREKSIDTLSKKQQSNSTKFTELLKKLEQELTPEMLAKINQELISIQRTYLTRKTGQTTPDRFERVFNQLLRATASSNEGQAKRLLLDIEKIILAESSGSRVLSTIPPSFSEMKSYKSIQQLATEIYFLNEIMKYIRNIEKYIKFFSLRSEQLTLLDTKVRDELKKYKEMYYFLEKIKTFIRTYSSSNPVLQEKFKNSSSLIQFFKIANNAKDNKKIEYQVDAYEVGLILESSHALEKKDKEKSQQNDFSFSLQQHTCEIYVRLDVVRGLLNPENLSAIRCTYRNASLIQQYYRVTDKELNPLILYKNKRLIDIDMLMKKNKTQKKDAEKTQKTRPVMAKKKGGFQPSLRSTPISISVSQQNEVNSGKRRNKRKPNPNPNPNKTRKNYKSSNKPLNI
jgi:hypothetical protein